MNQPAAQAAPQAGLNLRIDMSKVEEALASQSRITVSTVQGDQSTTLLEIAKVPGIDPNLAADNQVNVLC
jgi:hypothetical protein